MQELMAVHEGPSVEVSVRQVSGVGEGGYGVMVGGSGVSARVRGARRVMAARAIAIICMMPGRECA